MIYELSSICTMHKVLLYYGKLVNHTALIRFD